MKGPAIDANVLIRFVRADHPQQSPASRTLIERVSNGDAEVLLPETALCDTVWTLQSHYKLPRRDIAQFALDLMALTGVRMARKPVARQAVALYAETAVDFSDALIVAEMVHDDRRSIHSYDRDFDRLAGISRMEP